MHSRPRSFRAPIPAGSILLRRPVLEQGGAQLARVWVKAHPPPAYALRIEHCRRLPAARRPQPPPPAWGSCGGGERVSHWCSRRSRACTSPRRVARVVAAGATAGRARRGSRPQATRLRVACPPAQAQGGRRAAAAPSSLPQPLPPAASAPRASGAGVRAGRALPPSRRPGEWRWRGSNEAVEFVVHFFLFHPLLFWAPRPSAQHKVLSRCSPASRPSRRRCAGGGVAARGRPLRREACVACARVRVSYRLGASAFCAACPPVPGREGVPRKQCWGGRTPLRLALLGQGLRCVM